MQVHDNADFSITVELTLAHFTTVKGWLKKFRISEIFARLVWGVIEPPSVVFSVCHNLYQKLVFCWHVYDRCTICRFINWYPDVTS